uniref:Retrotransposon Copia-like N-terminal domain-containing protein n=1 Tax=Lactuca sativa TaxID=4236 RepID=A0A9R1WFG5_LACSA|nr:hypothetical protein LSAT_V11C200060820 [Lactuca sativa]
MPHYSPKYVVNTGPNLLYSNASTANLRIKSNKNLLRDVNYSDWENEMTNALYAKNKIGFFDGTQPMLKEDSIELTNWKRCNAMVRGWLVSSTEKEIKGSVKYATTARDMWLDLKERFGKENAPWVYELRRAVTSIQKNNLTVSSYYTKLRSVWDEIQSISQIPACSCTGCTCRINKEIAKLRDKERLYDYLVGLDEEFNAVKTQILSSSPLPTLTAGYHLVSQDEQQRQIRVALHDNRNKSIKSEDKWCTHCKKTGHMVDGCFELIGYLEWWNTKNTNMKNQTGRQKTQAKAATVTEDKVTQLITKEDYENLMRMLKSAKVNEENPKANMSDKSCWNSPYNL